MKQTNDDEERRVLQLQEHFFTDSDFHDSKNNDRSFRVRMRKDDANIDWKKVLGKMDHVNDEDAGEEDENFDEGKIEKLKWKLEQEKNVRNLSVLNLTNGKIYYIFRRKMPGIQQSNR